MEIFIKSIELMIIGMGMTFTFLILLVGTMKALKLFVEQLNKYFPEAVPAQQNSHAAPAGINAKIAVAIALAKHHSK